MSLTGISSLQSASKKFFMISSQNMCSHLESHVFGLRSQNESNSHQLARIGEKKIFHGRTCVKTWNQTFLGSGESE